MLRTLKLKKTLSLLNLLLELPDNQYNSGHFKVFKNLRITQGIFFT